MIAETAVREMTREEILDMCQAYKIYCEYYRQEAEKWESKYKSLLDQINSIVEDSSADTVCC